MKCGKICKNGLSCKNSKPCRFHKSPSPKKISPKTSPKTSPKKVLPKTSPSKEAYKKVLSNYGFEDLGSLDENIIFYQKRFEMMNGDMQGNPFTTRYGIGDVMDLYNVLNDLARIKRRTKPDFTLDDMNF